MDNIDGDDDNDNDVKKNDDDDKNNDDDDGLYDDDDNDKSDDSSYDDVNVGEGNDDDDGNDIKDDDDDDLNDIGHFGKYHNTLCLSPQNLHKHCFQFLLGLSMVPRENKNNAYAKFWGTNKEYYGIFRNGLYYNDCKDVDEGDEDHGSGKDDVDYDEYG